MRQASQVEPAERELSARDQVERVFEAGQRMIAARFDLLSLELKQTLSAGLKLSLFSGLGAVMLLLGHIAGMIAVALGLALVMPGWVAALIVAGIHFVLGGVAMTVGLTRRHAPRLGVRPEEVREAERRRLSGPTTGHPLPVAPARLLEEQR